MRLLPGGGTGGIVEVKLGGRGVPEPAILFLVVETAEGFELSYMILFESGVEVSVFLDVFSCQLFESVQVKLPDERADVRVPEVPRQAVCDEPRHVP